MSNEVAVDPQLVNQAYKQMLAEAQEQLALYQAGITQLRQQMTTLKEENKQLTAQNEQLMASTGRRDGIPDEDAKS